MYKKIIVSLLVLLSLAVPVVATEICVDLQTQTGVERLFKLNSSMIVDDYFFVKGDSQDYGVGILENNQIVTTITTQDDSIYFIDSNAGTLVGTYTKHQTGKGTLTGKSRLVGCTKPITDFDKLGKTGTFVIDESFNKADLDAIPELWYDRMWAQINRTDSTKLPDNMRGNSTTFNDVKDCSLLLSTCSKSSSYGYAISSDTYVYGRQINIQLTSLLNALRVTGDKAILDEINGIAKLMYAELEDDAYGDYSIRSLTNQNYVSDGYRNWRQWYDGATTTKTGTYTRSGSKVTLSIANHGLVSKDKISLDFAAGTGGTATDGSYTVTVVNTGTYTVVDSTSGTITKGTVGQKSGYFGTDIHEMNEIMAHGFVASMAYALHSNRGLPGTSYGDDAANWVNYLRNDYEAKWRDQKNVTWPKFPFTYRPFTHVYANQIRYQYYMWKLLSEDPLTSYYDLEASEYYHNEAVRMSGVLVSHMKTIPDVCGTTDAFQWPHMMDGTPGIQPTNYAGYTAQAMADLAMERFAPFGDEGFMEKVACTVTTYVMDENAVPNVSGSLDGTGTWNGYIYSPYTDIGYWDSTGEIIKRATAIHEYKESNDNVPTALPISAGMLFSTLKP